MEESDSLHPVTKMLLARMEEHPDEFLEEEFLGGRWSSIIQRIRSAGLPEDVEVLNRAIGKVTMDKIHTDAMDELINGPERRERERAERKARIRGEAQRASLAQQLYAQQSNQLGTLTGLGSGGYGNAAAAGLLGQQGTTTASLQIGNETLTESTISKIKKVLSL